MTAGTAVGAIRLTPARRNFLLTAALQAGGTVRRVQTEFGTRRFEAGPGPEPATLRDDLGQQLIAAGYLEPAGRGEYRVTEAGRIALDLAGDAA